MHVKLIVVEGHARQREIEVELPAWIGRSRAAEVTIGDPKVSRQHCQLYEEDGMLMVRDNDSMNGTWLDGEQVAEAVVEPGAKLTIGPLTLMAIYEPAGELPPAAAPAPAAAGEVDFAALIAGSEDDAEDGPGTETVAFLPPAAEPESFIPPDVSAKPAEVEQDADAPNIEQGAKPVPRAIEINQEVPLAKPAADEPAASSFEPGEEDDEEEEVEEQEVEEEEEPAEVPAEPAPAASQDGPTIGPPEDFEAEDEDEGVDDDALGDFFKGLP